MWEWSGGRLQQVEIAGPAANRHCWQQVDIAGPAACDPTLGDSIHGTDDSDLDHQIARLALQQKAEGTAAHATMSQLQASVLIDIFQAEVNVVMHTFHTV